MFKYLQNMKGYRMGFRSFVPLCQCKNSILINIGLRIELFKSLLKETTTPPKNETTTKNETANKTKKKTIAITHIKLNSTKTEKFLKRKLIKNSILNP